MTILKLLYKLVSSKTGKLKTKLRKHRKFSIPAGLDIATHWSPMRPNFQNWSPAGDSRFVRWVKKTTTQLLFLNLYIRKSIGYGS